MPLQGLGAAWLSFNSFVWARRLAISVFFCCTSSDRWAADDVNSLCGAVVIRASFAAMADTIASISMSSSNLSGLSRTISVWYVSPSWSAICVRAMACSRVAGNPPWQGVSKHAHHWVSVHRSGIVSLDADILSDAEDMPHLPKHGVADCRWWCSQTASVDRVQFMSHNCVWVLWYKNLDNVDAHSCPVRIWVLLCKILLHSKEGSSSCLVHNGSPRLQGNSVQFLKPWLQGFGTAAIAFVNAF